MKSTVLVKRRDETAELYHHPGVTQAKRPKIHCLAKDGSIDLKRFLPASDPKHRAEDAAAAVLSNAERAVQSMEQLTLVNYVLNSPLPVNRYPHHTHLEVHFSREQLQQAARHMKKRLLWGDGIYTADSDLFCALVHQGYLPWRSLESSYSWPDNMRELHAIIEVLPSPDSFTGCSQNGMRSRSWGSPCHSCAFGIRRCWMAVLLPQQLNTGGNRSDAIDVELDSLPAGTQSDSAKPFFVLSHFDHRISTRQVTYSGATGRRRNQSEVATVLFNLANEPWMKYNPSSVADCGFAAEQYTVSQFHTDVLYLESHMHRYEVSMVTDANVSNQEGEPAYLKFCKCKFILPEDLMIERGVPLPSADKEAICSRVSWEALQWGANSLMISASDVDEKTRDALTKGKDVFELPIVRIHWFKIREPTN